MAAQDRFLQGGAHGALESIEIRFEMKVQVQSFMVDALETDRDFAVRGSALDTGKAGHASNGRTSWIHKRIRFQKLQIVQPLVDAAVIDQLFVRSESRRCVLDRGPRSCRRAGWWTGDAR